MDNQEVIDRAIDADCLAYEDADGVVHILSGSCEMIYHDGNFTINGHPAEDVIDKMDTIAGEIVATFQNAASVVLDAMAPVLELIAQWEVNDENDSV